MDEHDLPTTMNAAASELYLDESEVRARLDRMTDVECWKLLEVARIYADGTRWTADDLLQEAFVAAATRRAWRADLSTAVFFTGVMRSLASAQRKTERVSALDVGLMGAEEDRQTMLQSISDEHANDPQGVLTEQQDYSTLIERLDALFADDAEIRRVIEGRARGEDAAETRAALGVDSTQYETICRRLSRRYRQSIRRQSP